MGKLELQQKREAKYSKNDKRFYTSLDMAIAKHDQAVRNSKIKRGEMKRGGTEYIADCGCGSEGCFLHGGYDTPKVEKEVIVKKNKNELSDDDKKRYLRSFSQRKYE
jgi:hypothetical protein